MSRMRSFLGLPDASDKVLRLAKTMFILGPIGNFTFMISSTFYMIFIAEALGGGDFIQGLGLVGTLVVIQMAIQTILDYPSGAIGDWIGQRYVIAVGNFSYGISFFMVSLVTSATSFTFLIAIYVLQGFANSQISGAWGAWFDNNYRVAQPSDEDRTQYGAFWGRTGMVMQIVSTAALIPGGILAVTISRAWVFQMQAIGAILFSLLVLRLIRDFPEVEAMREERPSMSEYVNLLRGGVKYLFSHPFVKYLILGSMLATSTIMVWGNLILFPMYFSYLLTDIAVSGYRTVLFLPGVVTQERSGIWSKRFEAKKWIPRFRLVQACGFMFFFIFALIMLVFPPIDNGVFFSLTIPFTAIELFQFPVANAIPIILIFSTFTVTMFFGAFADILTQRELIDVIPNKIRNSMYSLSPTIATIFAIPQIAIFSWLIPLAGFPVTLALVGLVSLCGVVVIRHGLNQPKPIIDKETGADISEPESPSIEEVDDAEEPITTLAKEAIAETES
ncbi:MAG: MFS transporter [Candidatus Thorarchaeota archaeon]